MATGGGGRPTGRRKERRHRGPSKPADVALALRGARQRLGLTLAEVHERTGVAWQELESLESADLGRFSDQDSARRCLRQYAQLLDLDADTLCAALDAVAPGVPGAPGMSGVSGVAATHLRPFTQTAQVPMVAGAGGRRTGNDPRFVTTGTVPAVTWSTSPRPAPGPLRAAVWTLAVLMAIGVAGLGVHAVR
ncbi:MAG: helix-turn-helix domain-containing protein, partial [Acidimicrobiales bacterium]